MAIGVHVVQTVIHFKRSKEEISWYLLLFRTILVYNLTFMKDLQHLTIDLNSISVYFRNHILITSRPQIPHCISFWHNIWTYALILNAATISIYHTLVFFWGWYNIKMSVVFQLCKIYHADFAGAWRAYEIQGIVSILLFRCNANNVFVIISSSYAKRPFDVSRQVPLQKI